MLSRPVLQTVLQLNHHAWYQSVWTRLESIDIFVYSYSIHCYRLPQTTCKDKVMWLSTLLRGQGPWINQHSPKSLCACILRGFMPALPVSVFHLFSQKVLEIETSNFNMTCETYVPINIAPIVFMLHAKTLRKSAWHGQHWAWKLPSYQSHLTIGEQYPGYRSPKWLPWMTGRCFSFLVYSLWKDVSTMEFGIIDTLQHTDNIGIYNLKLCCQNIC